MKLDRRIVLLVLVLALAAFVAYLALRNRQAPVLPQDEEHAGFFVLEECLSCHGPDGGFPQGPNHPINQQCMSCHAR